MKSGELLFVYGTLLRGEWADITKKNIYDVQFLCKDAINAKLYHLGAFPGVKLEALPEGPEHFNPNFPIVHGEVYLIGSTAVIAVLDAYESYIPPEKGGGGLYGRSQVLSKSSKLVWVYTYNPPVMPEQLIETGDWRNPRLGMSHRVPNIGRQ